MYVSVFGRVGCWVWMGVSHPCAPILWPRFTCSFECPFCAHPNAHDTLAIKSMNYDNLLFLVSHNWRGMVYLSLEVQIVPCSCNCVNKLDTDVYHELVDHCGHRMQGKRCLLFFVKMLVPTMSVRSRTNKRATNKRQTKRFNTQQKLENTLFFYKNLVYKNIKASNGPKMKNIQRLQILKKKLASNSI